MCPLARYCLTMSIFLYVISLFLLSTVASSLFHVTCSVISPFGSRGGVDYGGWLFSYQFGVSALCILGLTTRLPAFGFSLPPSSFGPHLLYDYSLRQCCFPVFSLFPLLSFCFCFRCVARTRIPPYASYLVLQVLLPANYSIISPSRSQVKLGKGYQASLLSSPIHVSRSTTLLPSRTISPARSRKTKKLSKPPSFSYVSLFPNFVFSVPYQHRLSAPFSLYNSGF